MLSGLLMATTALVMVPEVEAQQTGSLNSWGSNLHDVSGDGRVFVGILDNGDDTSSAIIGDANGTRVIPGLNPNYSRAYAINGNGTVVVGETYNEAGTNIRAWRYVANGGAGAAVDLGQLIRNMGSEQVYGRAVSGDGTRVGGFSQWNGNRRGWVWIEGGTGGVAGNEQMYMLNGLDGGYNRSGVVGLSDDGRYAVGMSDGDALTSLAVRWDLAPLAGGGEAGILNLGALTGMRGHSVAMATSSNGSVVVGRSDDADGRMRAFRWREGATNGVASNVQMLNLGSLGGEQSFAEGVSRDGVWVVGHSDVDEELQLGFRWSEETGMESINDWLERHGVTTGNVLNAANGISDDGRVVVGQMIDPTTGNIYGYLARSDSDNGGGLMNVDEYQRTLFDGAGSVANAGELLMWLPMNGAHHRPLMMTPSLSGDMCAWATGDFALHSGTSTGLGLAEMGACGDLAGGAVRLGGAVGTSRSWQDLALGGSSRMAGQYVLGEVDWQPDGTPLLLSLSGTIGSWQAQVDRAYSNGEDIGISRGETNAVGGVVRLRADWLNAAVLGNTSITPWTSIGLGTLHVNGFTEQGGPFPARFDAQNLAHVDVRLGVTAVTELSTQTSLSTTFEVAHRSGTGAKASGQVEGLFDFSMGGGQVSHNWVRAGAELDHKINDHLSLSGSVHLASSGRDPSLAASLGLKGSF